MPLHYKFLAKPLASLVFGDESNRKSTNYRTRTKVGELERSDKLPSNP